MDMGRYYMLQIPRKTESHGMPSESGGGLLHSRVLVFIPPLHVVEHEAQAFHSLQPPFTV